MRLDAALRARLRRIVSDEGKRRAARDNYVGRGVHEEHEEPARVNQRAPEHLPSVSESEIRRTLNER